MDKIVLDTNCLIMAISSKTEYHKIWNSFIAGNFVLCISNDYGDRRIYKNITLEAA